MSDPIAIEPFTIAVVAEELREFFRPLRPA
jgi:hypothetical protein